MSTSSPVRNILITGSSRGLGLEFVRQYLPQPNTHVIATARNLANATALQELKQKYSNLTLIELDSTWSPETIHSKLASLPPLSIAINNAGIDLSQHGIEEATPDELRETFNTNVVGAFVTMKATLSALKRAHTQYHIRPVVANITSALGSIKMVTERQFFDGTRELSYRVSKAALNMLTATVAQEYTDITFVCLCPGWVDTDLGRSGGITPPLKPPESVSGMRSVIDKIKPEQSGHFIDYNGTELAF